MVRHSGSENKLPALVCCRYLGTAKLQHMPYSTDETEVGDYSVPSYAEARIHKLCDEALAAKTPAYYVDRIVKELRTALEEHIGS